MARVKNIQTHKTGKVFVEGLGSTITVHMPT
jgi:hypothetical protein